ncbi:protein Dr1 isoform X2 [Pieris napi]|uniref:protein Dr1 isoform X2 n=1 Tax=Pieris rapae TaxID=64459 RepID=UPI000B925BC1|nr:protein Dr1 isoform X2 [Pieris rapae]XP_047516339.1 protein Dr1 isoform X2 [Pieris napi]
MGSPERELCPPPSEEDELTLPRASINKMIKELVPSVRVAFESRELILNCCTEFIHLISSEANEVCNQSNKKTINAEHVLTALDKLGFSDYTVEAEAVLKDCKAVAAKRRRQSTRLENLGIPEEELLRQQQELFAKNKLSKNNSNGYYCSNRVLWGLKVLHKHIYHHWFQNKMMKMMTTHS